MRLRIRGVIRPSGEQARVIAAGSVATLSMAAIRSSRRESDLMSRGAELRSLLAAGPVAAPGVFNAMAARAALDSGFKALYVSGAGLANAAGLPDIGLLTATEVAHQVSLISGAAPLPAIVDIDTGFGEACNVMRTVQLMEAAGAAAVHLEDQVFPKKCGHLPGKQVIPKGEMVSKIRAALDGRKDPNFMIIARTDSRAVENLDAAVERALAYREAGADMIFPEALETIDEFREFARRVPGPLLANMTEFGKTPFLSLKQFGEIGYGLVIFPMTAFRMMLRAVQEAYATLAQEGTQVCLLDRMATRKELYRLLDYDGYDERDRCWR
jgi:methylisocitrate lyase